jgi:hypothetical protein
LTAELTQIALKAGPLIAFRVSLKLTFLGRRNPLATATTFSRSAQSVLPGIRSIDYRFNRSGFLEPQISDLQIQRSSIN